MSEWLDRVLYSVFVAWVCLLSFGDKLEKERACRSSRIHVHCCDSPPLAELAMVRHQHLSGAKALDIYE